MEGKLCTGLSKLDQHLAMPVQSPQIKPLLVTHLFEAAHNRRVSQTICVTDSICYAAAVDVHEQIVKDRRVSVTSNSSTSVVHQCGNGGTGIE